MSVIASAQLLDLTQLCASFCTEVLAANRSSMAMHDLTSLQLLLISVQLLCQVSSAALVAARNVIRQSLCCSHV